MSHSLPFTLVRIFSFWSVHSSFSNFGLNASGMSLMLRNCLGLRSEKKEVLSKKITQHARYKTCTFLSCPTLEKKTLNNQLLRPLSRETSAAIWSCFYQKLKGSCRNVRDSERVELQAGLRCSKGSLRFPLREAAVRLFPS